MSTAEGPNPCFRSALQFVIVTDPERRRTIGEAYRSRYATCKSLDGVSIGSIEKGDPERDRQQQRILSAGHSVSGVDQIKSVAEIVERTRVEHLSG